MSSSLDSPEILSTTSFVPAEDINLEVLKYYYVWFLDDNATITVHSKNRNIHGYLIHSRKLLNKTYIEDIKLDSRDWDEEQRRRARSGLQKTRYLGSETAKRRLKNRPTNIRKSTGHPSRMPANRYNANGSAPGFSFEVGDQTTQSTARQTSFAPQSAAKNAINFEDRHRRAQPSDYRTDRRDLQYDLASAAAHSDPMDIDEETGLSSRYAHLPSNPRRDSALPQTKVPNREQQPIRTDPRSNFTLPLLSCPQQHSYSTTEVLPNPFDSIRRDQSASATSYIVPGSHTASANSGMAHRARYEPTSRSTLVSQPSADNDDDRMYGRQRDPNQNSNRHKAPEMTRSGIEEDSGDEMSGWRPRPGRVVDSAPGAKSRASDQGSDNKRSYGYDLRNSDHSRSAGEFLDRLAQKPPLTVLNILYRSSTTRTANDEQADRKMMPGEADWYKNCRAAESHDIALRRRLFEIILWAARAGARSNLSEYELRSMLYNFGLEICTIHDFKVLGQNFLDWGADGRGIGPMTRESFVSLAELQKSHAMLKILRTHGSARANVAGLNYSTN